MICSSRLRAVFLWLLFFLPDTCKPTTSLMHPACIFIMILCHSPPVSWCYGHVDLLSVSHTHQAFLPQTLLSSVSSSWKISPQIAHLASSFSVFGLQPKHPQRGLPSVLRQKFPFVLPQRHRSQELLSFALCIKFPGELVKNTDCCVRVSDSVEPNELHF